MGAEQRERERKTRRRARGHKERVRTEEGRREGLKVLLKTNEEKKRTMNGPKPV